MGRAFGGLEHRDGRMWGGKYTGPRPASQGPDCMTRNRGGFRVTPATSLLKTCIRSETGDGDVGEEGAMVKVEPIPPPMSNTVRWSGREAGAGGDPDIGR